LTMTDPSTKSQLGIITDINPDVEGQAVKSSDLKKITFEATYYDKIVSFAPIIGKTKIEVQTLWADYKFFNVTFEPADALETAVVKEVLVNGVVVNSQKLTNGTTITIRLE
ncbi:MAG: hypothetical protein Q8N92_07630, partial [Erysipelotrichaceae bacterium]|nr:hypothetical protein [Erysipelotrichaceae bacterium]